jgi:hypothetical protein
LKITILANVGKPLLAAHSYNGCGFVFILTIAIMFTVGTLILLRTSVVFYKKKKLSFSSRGGFHLHATSLL